jgi:phosphohistidine phosphatase SixA
MRLFIVRHAKAAQGEPDEQRPLTERGRAAALELGQRLGGEQLDAVVSSPLVRARETAEAIARAADLELEIDERLAPGADAAAVRAVVAGRGDTVVVVGHQPDCTEIVFELTGRQVPFSTGAFLEVAL